MGVQAYSVQTVHSFNSHVKPILMVTIMKEMGGKGENGGPGGRLAGGTGKVGKCRTESAYLFGYIAVLRPIEILALLNFLNNTCFPFGL